MTAIILAFTMTGIGALAVDTGILYTERQQAQNGADAAALSVAQSCATSAAGCTDISGDPSQWAQDNAKSSMANISVLPGSTGVCGVADGLAPCADPDGDTSKLPDCPGLPSSPPPNYVEVHTAADNSVQAFSIHGTEHPGACSRVGWGPISKYTGPLPLTFSGCEWANATGNGATYAPSPPYPPDPDPSLLREIDLADSSHPTNCGQFNGHDAPGGFGWLNTGPGCELDITVGNWYQVDTGNNVSSDCKPVIESMVNTIVFVPVFDCMNSVGSWPADPTTQCATGNGTHLWYHLYQLAAFYLTGYQLGSISHTPPDGPTTCQGNGNSGRCLFGYFVQAVAPPGGTIGGPGTPDLGVKAIQMIG